MNSNDKAYNKLKKKYSADELADSIMLPEILGEQEEAQANEELAKLRMQRKKSMNEKDKLLSSLLNLKYKLKQYFLQKEGNLKFGEVLKAYLKIIGRSQKEFADEIGLHPSRLNRIIKGRERIGKAIIYRLENHCGNIIPAIYWWKIIQKEVETEILTETEAREIERKFVKKVAYRA